MQSLLVHNADCIATFDHVVPAWGRELRNASLFVRGNVIEWIGPAHELPPALRRGRMAVSRQQQDRGLAGAGRRRVHKALGGAVRAGAGIADHQKLRRCLLLQARQQLAFGGHAAVCFFSQ